MSSYRAQQLESLIAKKRSLHQKYDALERTPILEYVQQATTLMQEIKVVDHMIMDVPKYWDTVFHFDVSDIPEGLILSLNKTDTKYMETNSFTTKYFQMLIDEIVSNSEQTNIQIIKDVLIPYMTLYHIRKKVKSVDIVDISTDLTEVKLTLRFYL